MNSTTSTINKPSSTKQSSAAGVLVAFYARVSSERQADEQTIQSQIAAIRERITADGLTFNEDHGFIDDGESGTTLMRPSLERLRDKAYSGGVQRLYALTGSVGKEVCLSGTACR